MSFHFIGIKHQKNELSYLTSKSAGHWGVGGEGGLAAHVSIIIEAILVVEKQKQKPNIGNDKIGFVSQEII